MSGIEAPFAALRRKMVVARIDFMSQLATFRHEDLTRSLAEDNISPLLITRHLLVTDILALKHMQRVQSEDNPQFDTFIQLLPIETTEAEPPPALDEILAKMAVQRDELFAYLAQIPLAGWERPFCSASWESRKFYQLVNVLPLHDRQHSRQLTNIRTHLDL
jgi:hypothetical protein